MKTKNENEETIIPYKAEQGIYHEHFWKGRHIEEREKKRIRKERRTESWWLEEGPHGFEIITYIGQVKMLNHQCSKVKEIPLLMDHQVFTFFKTSNYDINKAFNLILKHYEHRKNIVETFEHRNPYLKKHQKVWSYIKMAVLPKISIRDTKLIFIGLWNYDPSVCDFFSVLRMFNMAIEACTICFNMHTSYEFIIDGEGFSSDHIPPYMRGYFFKFVRYLLEGFPLNVRAIHVINASNELHSLIRTLIVMISKKIQSKIYHHSYNNDNLKLLFHTLGKRNIPSDIEGYGECVYLGQERFRDHVESLWGWFKREETEWTRMIYHITSESNISLTKHKEQIIDNIDHEKDFKKEYRKKLEQIHNKTLQTHSNLTSDDSFNYFKNEKDCFDAQINWPYASTF
ncbi:hypothetical protein O3M35_006163 [Rhynocoris fuscipes]|uniref:CRAL-TRIO domain-containing protein n=1 Tax=Rhynocoris fuscipes TaxID=488301 RepID=A0AAW1DHK5_9HEMI